MLKVNKEEFQHIKAKIELLESQYIKLNLWQTAWELMQISRETDCIENLKLVLYVGETFLTLMTTSHLDESIWEYCSEKDYFISILISSLFYWDEIKKFLQKIDLVKREKYVSFLFGLIEASDFSGNINYKMLGAHNVNILTELLAWDPDRYFPYFTEVFNSRKNKECVKDFIKAVGFVNDRMTEERKLSGGSLYQKSCRV